MSFRSTQPFLRFVLCATAALWTIAAPAQQADPGSARSFGRSQPVMDRYIVVFRGHVANPAAEAGNAVASAGGQVHFTYTAAIKGFSATLPAPALAAMRNNPNVDYIEQDQTVSLSADQSPATWGIDRVDQRDLGLNQTYHYDNTGSGVTAFIIDTGIRPDHVEFTGRLLAGFTSVSDGNGTNDCNGHGTHVAGTVGGTVYGVAKQVQLVPVRVLNCQGSGTWSGVIAGIDWVANNHGQRTAVANMSLGGGFSTSVNSAVAGAVSKGVIMAVAAGNDGLNACNYSPASEPSAITVGATTSGDSRASYSNTGSCVDIFAPGSSITSAWKTSSASTNTISGTSMATPHVAGAAALMAQANPGATPATIASLLTGNATPNKVSSAGTGSPNLLLYTLTTTGTPPPAIQTVAVRLPITTSTSLIGKGAKVRGWQATATVTVYDISSTLVVANATVSGKFDSGASGSCLTGSNGSCTISSGTLSLAVPSTVFTATGVTGTNMIFDGNAVQKTILKP